MTQRISIHFSGFVSWVLVVAICAWLMLAIFFIAAGIHDWHQFATDPVYRAEILRIQGRWNYESPPLYIASLVNLVLVGTVFSTLGITALRKRGIWLIWSNVFIIVALGLVLFIPIDEMLGRLIANFL